MRCRKVTLPKSNGDNGLTSVPVPFFSGAWPIGARLSLRTRSRSARAGRPLTDTERDMVAEAIVEHIKLCNWKVERGPPWEGFLFGAEV
jgi:hypothetical protein